MLWSSSRFRINGVIQTLLAIDLTRCTTTLEMPMPAGDGFSEEQPKVSISVKT
jgi:hypothetical protein